MLAVTLTRPIIVKWDFGAGGWVGGSVVVPCPTVERDFGGIIKMAARQRPVITIDLVCCRALMKIAVDL